jgi:hypothetical protein
MVPAMSLKELITNFLSLEGEEQEYWAQQNVATEYKNDLVKRPVLKLFSISLFVENCSSFNPRI